MVTDSAEAVLHDGGSHRHARLGRGPGPRPEPRHRPLAVVLVIAADYEGHRMAHPAPDTLTPENVAADILAIADAAAADRFGYYGYSWLALCGLQLAIRTDRLWALVMGGFPPLEGPYKSMLAVTRAAPAAAAGPAEQTQAADVPVEPGDWDDAAAIQTTEAQTRQFVRLYEALQDFDDSTAAVAPGLPRLAFAGSGDQIDYGPRWGDVQVRIGAPLAEHKHELTAAGWDVQVLPGLDHLGAMQSSVIVPLLKTWLDRVPGP